MKKLLYIKLFLFLSIFSFGQARLVINGTKEVNLVEHGGTQAIPIYIEIANPNPNAITVFGKLGWIVSEEEFNMIKWNIGATTGTYIIPFGYSSLYYLPLTDVIGAPTAGLATATGCIFFSTYHTDPDNGDGTVAPYNVSPYHVYPDIVPSDVTNMHSMNSTGFSPSLVDNSYNAVDRFWIIDTYSNALYKYTNKPTASEIIFSYISSAGTPSEVSSPNVFTEINLVAQRFNPSAGMGWGDFLGAGSDAPGGTIGTATNSLPISSSNFYRTWTLSNSTEPLPIVLSSFTDECYGDSYALIKWTSLTELDNAYYTVKKTSDDIHFETVGIVPGAGNSVFPIDYSIIDSSPFAGISYYALYQTDFVGNANQLGIIQFENCSPLEYTTINAWITNDNYINVQINSVSDDNFDITLTNILGQVIIKENKTINIGENDIRLNDNNLSQGIYIININDNDKYNWSRKLEIIR